MNIATDYTDCTDYAEKHLRESAKSAAKKTTNCICENAETSSFRFLATDYNDCADYTENDLRESAKSAAKKSASSICEMLL